MLGILQFCSCWDVLLLLIRIEIIIKLEICLVETLFQWMNGIQDSLYRK